MREFNYNAHVMKNIQTGAGTGAAADLGSNNQNIYFGASVGKPSTPAQMKEYFEPHHDNKLNSGRIITGSPMIVANSEGRYYLQWIKYDHEQ